MELVDTDQDLFEEDKYNKMGIMDVTYYTIKQIIFCDWTESSDQNQIQKTKKVPSQKKLAFFQWLRSRIDGVEVRDSALAHRICQLIPSQCPFARDIKVFGRTIVTIPPLCKINPFYEELMALRWRALCYLADECSEDISAYC